MKYRELKGYKYAITEDELVPTKIISFIVTPYIRIANGTMTIKTGYAWDGASGAIDTKTFMTGSLVHDAYYQLMREGHIGRGGWRKYADQELRRIMLKEIAKVYQAMPKNTPLKKSIAALYLQAAKFRAWYVYRTVRLTGKKHTFPRKHPRGKIIEI